MLENPMRHFVQDPMVEDLGLFKTPLTDVTAQVTAQRARNGRGDILLTGYMKRDARIEVLFAGRRRDLAKPLIALITRHWMAERGSLTLDAEQRIAENVRVPVDISGSWRTRFERDRTGWQHKIHQLIVAHWQARLPDGRLLGHGEAPCLAARPDLAAAPVARRA